MTDLLRFVGRLLEIAGAALRLDPDLMARASAHRDGDALIAVMTALAGSSLLVGHSVTLFVNGVRPVRFVFTLCVRGVVFALSVASWAALVWLSGRFVFGSQEPLVTALRLSGLAVAPLLFGFMIFVPHLGSLIGWGLHLWSAWILIAIVRAEYPGAFGPVVVLIAMSWTLTRVLHRLLDRRLAPLREKLWLAATGTRFATPEQEIATAIAAARAQLAESPAAKRSASSAASDDGMTANVAIRR